MLCENTAERGPATLCIGGVQGIAVIVENLSLVSAVKFAHVYSNALNRHEALAVRRHYAKPEPAKSAETFVSSEPDVLRFVLLSICVPLPAVIVVAKVLLVKKVALLALPGGIYTIVYGSTFT
jgi:hypothetical protein